MVASSTPNLSSHVQSSSLVTGFAVDADLSGPYLERYRGSDMKTGTNDLFCKSVYVCEKAGMVIHSLARFRVLSFPYLVNNRGFELSLI